VVAIWFFLIIWLIGSKYRLKEQAGVAQELSLEGLMNVHSDLWSPILT